MPLISRQLGRRRDWLTHPAVLASNALFFGLTFPGYRTARIATGPGVDAIAELARRDRRPLVYAGWHSDSWVSIPAFVRLPAPMRPTFLCHDRWSSRFNSLAGAWCGADMFEFEWDAARTPREQIVDYAAAEGAHVVLFGDSGGPYRVFKEGGLEVARALSARVVPFAIAAGRGTVTLGRTMQHKLFLLGARLTVEMGEPLDANDATPQRVGAAIDALHDARS